MQKTDSVQNSFLPAAPGAASEANGEVHLRLMQLLGDSGFAFKAKAHEPTLTSEESARARNEPLEIGGKALLLKLDQQLALFVMSASKKLDSQAACRLLGARKSRFVTREELLELTGLVPGSVPPFGEPILPFALYADESILAQARIAFNAGLLTYSVVLATADWLALAKPKIARFSLPS
jgi:Ala-tRNA(Pro) deacylase